MNEHGSYKFMGEGQFCWFTGIVEDIHDPLEAGRVKVRCYGYHSKDNTAVDRKHLPWAFVLSPTTSASVSGIGATPHNLVQGSQVVGFFRDGSSAQHPVIMGTLPSIPTKEADGTKGFNDPDGVYPLSSRLNQPDINQLAGMSHADSLYRTTRTDTLLKDVVSATGEKWSEPDSEAAPKYPENHVIETTSGHMAEIDSTEDSNRLHLRHSKGTYYEILDDGSVVHRNVSDNTVVVYGDSNTQIMGTQRVNVNKDIEIRIKNEMTILIDDDDINITVASGNARITIQGNVDLEVKGNMLADVHGNMDVLVDGDMHTDVNGDYSVTAKGSVTIKGSRINLN